MSETTYADDIKQLGDSIVGLTLKQAKELSDYLKEEHGIEAAAGYGRLLHGEAISLGIAAACVLSEKHANLSSPASQQLLRALATFNLPLRLPSDISTQSIMESLS